MMILHRMLGFPMVRRPFYLLGLLALFYASNSIAQTNQLDSLVQLLKSESIDSNKIHYINKIIEETGLESEAEIDVYFDQGLKICAKLKDDKLLYSLYNSKAHQLLGISSFGASERSFQELINLASAKADQRVVLRAKIGLAKLLVQQQKTHEAKEQLQAIIAVSQELKFPKITSKGYTQIAGILRTQGKLDSAMIYIKKGLDCFAPDERKIEVLDASLVKGRIFRAQGEYDSAYAIYLYAQDLAGDLKEPIIEARVFNNLGNIDQVKGSYEKAIANYVKSIKIKEALNDKRGLCVGYHNIGTIKNDMEDYIGSLESYETSMEIAKSLKDIPLQIHNLMRIGVAQKELKNYDEAIALELEALALSVANEYKKGHITSLYNLGSIYLDINDFPNAYKYYLEVLPIVQKMGSKPYESATLAAIAKTYAMEESEANQMDRASSNSSGYSDQEIYKILLRAKELADYMDAPENQMDVMEALVLYHQRNGQYKLASHAMEEFMVLKDSLFTVERNEAVSAWETKYDVEKKEREIIDLEYANQLANVRSQRNQFLFIGSILFFIGFIGFLLTYLKHRNSKIEAQKKEAFRSKLSSDLHDDVGSILTGLSMQTELLQMHVGDEHLTHFEKIGEMSRDAMTRMRDTVWAIDARKDKIYDLVDRILDFCEDALSPTGKKLNFNNNISEINKKINPEIRQNIYLIVKEAISNVIKYSDSNNVDMNLSIIDHSMVLQVFDFGTVKDIKPSGLGLANMKMRAQRLDGSFKYWIDNGFKIEVKIPLNIKA